MRDIKWVEFKETQDAETLRQFATAYSAYNEIKRSAGIIHELGGPKVRISRPLYTWMNEFRDKVNKIIGERKE